MIWTSSFSPDGKRVVTAAVNGFVRLWDAVSGKSWPASRTTASVVGVVKPRRHAWPPPRTLEKTARPGRAERQRAPRLRGPPGPRGGSAARSATTASASSPPARIGRRVSGRAERRGAGAARRSRRARILGVIQPRRRAHRHRRRSDARASGTFTSRLALSRDRPSRALLRPAFASKARPSSEPRRAPRPPIALSMRRADEGPPNALRSAGGYGRCSLRLRRRPGRGPSACAIFEAAGARRPDGVREVPRLRADKAEIDDVERAQSLAKDDIIEHHQGDASSLGLHRERGCRCRSCRPWSVDRARRRPRAPTSRIAQTHPRVRGIGREPRPSSATGSLENLGVRERGRFRQGGGRGSRPSVFDRAGVRYRKWSYRRRHTG